MGLAANKVYCVNANYSAVPTQLNYKKITLMVNVGNCSSVAVTADGASVPATYISSSGTALFTTTGSSINVTAVNWTSGGTGAATKATLYNNYHWAYSLTFDDNRQSQFDNGVTLLQQHGWRAAEAVVATWANSGGPGQYFMNWAELQTLRNTYGWDMMNHSNDHPNPLTCNGTATDIVSEVTQNQTALLSKFPGYYVNQMVFPYENSTANTCAGYPTTFLLSAECGGGSYNYVDTALPFQFQRGGMFGTNDTAWKSLADSAATNSRPTWLVEYTHSIAAGSGAAADAYSTNQATLGDLLNHLDSTYGATGNKSMWFAPAPEVRDYLFVRDNAVVTTCTAATPTPTSTPAVTLTPTATATATRTASMTPTPTLTPTNTATSTSTASRTNTSTATPSSTATRTPVPPTATLTPTGTLSSTPSSSPTGTPTTTRSMTPTPTFTPTDSTTATPTSSPTLTATPSASPSSTLTPTNTFVNSPTPTNTTTNTLTATRSSTPTGTATPTSTETPTWTTTSTSSATMTNTLINSPTPTQTATTSTRTSTVTATNTSRATASSTPTAALSWTKTFTSTSTVAVTSTETPTFTLTLTPTKTLSITPTAAGNTGVVLFPNPVTGPTVGILPPASNGPENVRIEIFTLSFRRVLDETSSNLPSGKTVTVQLDDRWGRSLADGIYYVVVSADGRRSIAKLMILR